MDLSNKHGDYFRFSTIGWSPTLDLAKRYGWKPDPGTPEADLTERFLVARDWLRDAD